MPGPPPKYRKLPGRSASTGEVSRLYLADDHLLIATATGFSESYRRFYLRDIQAITARKNVLGAFVNGLLGFFLFLMILGLASADDATAFIVWGILTGILLALLVGNILLGPACACELHTAVQSRRLTCVGRLRTARQLITRLRPVIEAAQGALPVEELRQRLDHARQHGLTADAPPVIRPGL